MYGSNDAEGASACAAETGPTVSVAARKLGIAAESRAVLRSDPLDGGKAGS